MSSTSINLPLVACDEILAMALWAVSDDPQLFAEIRTLVRKEGAERQTIPIFRYLFVPAEFPAFGADDAGVGFRLRDAEERLRYAHEVGLALVANHAGSEIA